MMGAVGLTGSITRAISVAIITLELNGEMCHLVPSLVCVLCSYITSEALNPESFFEMQGKFRGLEGKQILRNQIIVKDILENNPKYT